MNSHSGGWCVVLVSSREKHRKEVPDSDLIALFISPKQPFSFPANDNH